MRYTIIIITHKLDEVGQIADRVTVMRGGRIVGACCGRPRRWTRRLSPA